MNGFHRLVCFICVLFGCLYIVPLEAAIYRPTDVRTVSRDLQNFKMELTYYLEKTATEKTNPYGTMPKNKALTVVTGKSTIGSVARSAKKGTPLHLAVTGAVAAAGWAIDELTGQVTKPVEVPASGPDLPINDYYWLAPYVGSHHDTAMQAINAFLEAYNHSLVAITEGPYLDGTRYKVSYKYLQSDGRTINSAVYAYSCSTSCVYDLPTQIDYVPVSDADFDDEIIPRLAGVPANAWDQAFKDPFGRPKITPDLKNALDDWFNDIADRDPYLTYNPATGTFTYAPPPDVEGDPAPDPIVIDAKPEPPASEDESNDPRPGEDWPSFCTWASSVCEFIDWVKEEPENLEPEEMPVDQISASDFKRDYDSGLGSGSCPSDVSFSYGGQSFKYSFEPACTAASYIRPILIAAAGVIAAVIIAGSGRRAFV